jgi:hypothetical protein
MSSAPLLSRTDRALTYCGIQSNRLLWGGLLTVLVGVAMIAAAETYLSGRQTIYQWFRELGPGTDTTTLVVAYVAGFVVGGALTVSTACAMSQVKNRLAKRAMALFLALALATVAYASIVCALRNSGEIVNVRVQGGGTGEFLIANEGPLNALKGLSYTFMTAGAVAMGLGLGGFIYCRSKKPQIESTQEASNTLSSEEL